MTAIKRPPRPATVEKAAPEPTKDRQWYRHGVFYELLVRGFADSNDDGVGDILGPDQQAGLPAVAGGRLHLAAPGQPQPAARRRL